MAAGTAIPSQIPYKVDQTVSSVSPPARDCAVVDASSRPSTDCAAGVPGKRARMCL